MKVALNITREPLAGITSTNLSLLNYLHESDTVFTGIELNSYRTFQSSVIYRHLSPEWFNHYIMSICDFNLYRIIKKSRTLADVQKHYAPIIKTVRLILKQEKPDLFLINGAYFIPWILSIAAQQEGIPIVLWYAGVLAKEVEGMTPKFRRIFLQMEKSIVRRANRIIFPSHICQETVYKEVFASKSVKNGVIIPNPIAPVFTRTHKIEESVERRIAFIGRYTGIKNIQEFCLLHKRLLKMGWKHEATIVSDIRKKELKHIPATIKIISSMSSSDISTFYSSQGLIISPSHFETFGNVPIEAACLGIPALVSKNMGCAEVLIESGLEQMVVDFNDTDLVIKRVMQLCGQQILPRQLNNLRKRVDTKYVAHRIELVIKQKI